MHHDVISRCLAIVLVACLFSVRLAVGQVYTVPATDRTKIDLSSGTWKFIRSNTLTGAEAISHNDASWASVTIPHTWNTKADHTYNTNCWYRTHFTGAVSDTSGGKRFYLYFEAANADASIYLNGKQLGTHYGGYTAFIFDATAARVNGDNVLAVRVDNQNHTGLPSNGWGWVHYGGLIRRVWILRTNKYCVSPLDFASSGVY